MSSEGDLTVSQAVRVALVLGWSLMCGGFWLMWLATIANQPGDESVIAIAGCMATGCAGGAWVLGLAVLAMVYLIVRR